MTSSRPDLDVIVHMVPAGSRVLDLGCGDGTLLAELVAQKGVQGRGVEVDEAKVRACMSKGLSVRHGNIEDGLADFPDGMFDVVILSQTVAYLNRPLGVMQEMARVGRSAIISFENAGYWKARGRSLSRRRGRNDPGVRPAARAVHHAPPVRRSRCTISASGPRNACCCAGRSRCGGGHRSSPMPPCSGWRRRDGKRSAISRQRSAQRSAKADRGQIVRSGASELMRSAGVACTC